MRRCSSKMINPNLVCLMQKILAGKSYGGSLQCKRPVQDATARSTNEGNTPLDTGTSNQREFFPQISQPAVPQVSKDKLLASHCVSCHRTIFQVRVRCVNQCKAGHRQTDFLPAATENLSDSQNLSPVTLLVQPRAD